MLELSTLHILIGAIVVSFAGIIRGFAGFGSGMLMAPILSVLYSPIEAVCIIILLDAAATIQLMPTTHHQTEWKHVGLMGAVAVIFMPLGLWGLVSLESDVLTRIMGFVVISFALVMVTGWQFHSGKQYWSSVGVGAVSGVMMAATSLGNPIVMMYLMCSKDPSSVTRSNITSYFAITLTFMIMILIFKGLITKDVVEKTILFIPIFLMFTWLGGYLFNKANERAYRNVALVSLIFSGLVGLVA